jgi:hypothetical protein
MRSCARRSARLRGRNLRKGDSHVCQLVCLDAARHGGRVHPGTGVPVCAGEWEGVMIRSYHFCGATLRNGKPIPLDGEWLEYDGELPIIMCERGLHASVHPFDALRYAPGNTLCLVDLDGPVKSIDDKSIGTRRRIVQRADATEMLQVFARWCALRVIHLWDCPAVVKQYLETGNPSLQAAACDAAGDAARVASRAARAAALEGGGAARAARAAERAAWSAWDAAMAAAGSARDARDAARAAERAAGDAGAAEVEAQRKHLVEMVDSLFFQGRP